MMEQNKHKVWTPSQQNTILGGDIHLITSLLTQTIDMVRSSPSLLNDKLDCVLQVLPFVAAPHQLSHLKAGVPPEAPEAHPDVLRFIAEGSHVAVRIVVEKILLRSTRNRTSQPLINYRVQSGENLAGAAEESDDNVSPLTNSLATPMADLQDDVGPPYAPAAVTVTSTVMRAILELKSGAANYKLIIKVR
jgi:hypothetical protein